MKLEDYAKTYQHDNPFNGDNARTIEKGVFDNVCELAREANLRREELVKGVTQYNRVVARYNGLTMALSIMTGDEKPEALDLITLL